MKLTVYNSDRTLSWSYWVEIGNDNDMGINEIYIGEPHRTRDACVYMTVDETNEATLDGVQHRISCSIDKELEHGIGTVHMVKGALLFLRKMYPHIEWVYLNDKSTVITKKIHITAKRLLQGRKGWYEEHYGAIPMDKWTRGIMNELATPGNQAKIQQYLPITTKKSWGNAEEILTIAKNILPIYHRYIIGTSWGISKDTIDTYYRDISIEVTDDKEQTGGNATKRKKKQLHQSIKKKWNTVAEKSYRSWFLFQLHK